MLHEVEKAGCEAWGIDFEDFELHGILPISEGILMWGERLVWGDRTSQIFVFLSSKMVSNRPVWKLSRPQTHLYQFPIIGRISLSTFGAQKCLQTGLFEAIFEVNIFMK